MPRPLRPDLHGSWFHVINRGADRQDIFSCDADRLHFENLLASAVTKQGIELHAYALMSNHFHLLLHCPAGGLSATMKQVQSIYVESYNHHHGRSGPMFEGRFTSYLVQSATARHLTGRYIHRNPLDIVPSSALAAYRWSSLAAYTGHRDAPDWLCTGELKSLFSDSEAYLGFVTNRHDTDKQSERDGHAASVGRLIDLDRAVAALCRVPLDAIYRPHNRNTARLLAITLAVELRLTGSENLVEHYGLGSAGSVRATARRGRVRLIDDEAFAALRSVVLNQDDQIVAKGA